MLLEFVVVEAAVAEVTTAAAAAEPAEVFAAESLAGSVDLVSVTVNLSFPWLLAVNTKFIYNK